MGNRSDTFNRANGTLNGMTPSDGGSAWVASAGCSVVSNQLQTGGGVQTAYLEASEANVEVQATIAVEGSNAAMGFRFSDADNHLGLYVLDNYVHLIKRVSGSVTQDPLSDGSGTSTADNPISAGDVFKVRCEGNTITVYKNGVQQMQRTGVTFNNTATKHGFYKDGGGAPSWDDFSITVLATFSIDRDNVLCGSGTVTVTLTGSGTSWTGTPFSLTGAPTGWSISSQNVISGTSATVTLNKGSGTGAFSITDGTLSDSLTATNTATSVADGDWDVATTWDVIEAPVSGNLAVVNHNVNCDSATAIGSSPAEGNVVLTIAAGKTLLVETGQALTVKGDVTCNGILQVGEAGGGATLEFDASGASSPSSQQYKVLLNAATATFRTRGTSGSHSVVRSNAGGGNAYTVGGTGKGLWDCQWTDFTRIGDATFDAIDPANNTDPVSATTWVDLADCTFTSCGRVSTATGGLPAHAGVSIVRCKFISGVHATDDLRLSGLSTPNGSEARLVNLCSFEKAFYWTEGKLAVTNCVLDGEGGGVSGSGTWTAAQWTGNFFRLLSTSGGGIVGLTLRGDTDDSYFLADAGTDNPHILLPANTGSPQTVSDCIIEYTKGTVTDSGNWFYGGGTWTLDGCITLPGANVDSPGAVTSAGGSGTFSVIHCTLISPYYAGGILIGDGGTVSDEYPVVKSNIFWVKLAAASDGKASADVGATHPDNPITPSGCTHNGLLNMQMPAYEGTYPTTQPGANDARLDTTDEATVFVDPTRNIATWAVSRGSASSTYADKVTDARSYLRDDPSLVADLLAHVRAGFVVKHGPWRTAAHDSTVLGAVQDAPPAAAGSGLMMLLGIS